MSLEPTISPTRGAFYQLRLVFSCHIAGKMRWFFFLFFLGLIFFFFLEGVDLGVGLWHANSVICVYPKRAWNNFPQGMKNHRQQLFPLSSWTHSYWWSVINLIHQTTIPIPVLVLRATKNEASHLFFSQNDFDILNFSGALAVIFYLTTCCAKEDKMRTSGWWKRIKISRLPLITAIIFKIKPLTHCISSEQ